MIQAYEYDSMAGELEKIFRRLEPEKLFYVLLSYNLRQRNIELDTFIIQLKAEINTKIYVIEERISIALLTDTNDNFTQKIEYIYEKMINELMDCALRPRKRKHIKFSS